MYNCAEGNYLLHARHWICAMKSGEQSVCSSHARGDNKRAQGTSVVYPVPLPSPLAAPVSQELVFKQLAGHISSR